MGQPRRIGWGDLADSVLATLEPDALSVAVELVPPEPFLDAFDGPTMASLNAGLEALATAAPGDAVPLLMLTMGEGARADLSVVVFGKDDEILELSEVAGILRVSPATVRRLLESEDHDIWGIRVTPGKINVLRSELSEYVEALAAAAKESRERRSAKGLGGPEQEGRPVRIIPPTRRRRRL